MRGIVIAGALLALTAGAALAAAPAKGEFKNDEEKASYAIGYQIGAKMRQDKIEIRPQALARGAEDAAAGKEGKLTKEEMDKILQGLQAQAEKNSRTAAAAKDEKALAEGKAFMAANAKKEGVKVTASGLQYKVLTPGTGASPKPSDTVKVNYRGTLIDGTEFDSSYKRGQPASFRLDRVIKGWTEGVQLMTVGAKFQFVIPPDLAYGARGAGPSIGPNSTLIFEVELLEITPS